MKEDLEISEVGSEGGGGEKDEAPPTRVLA